MNFKNVAFVFASLLFTANSCLAQVNKNTQIWQKSQDWVKELNLDNLEKEAKVTEIIAKHRTAVVNWHNSHPFDAVPAGINPRTGNKLSNLDRSIIADSAIPSSVHKTLMTELRANLSEAQVEKILDKYTIGKVAFTMKAYHVIVTDLTEKEEAVILKNLKEAREMAIDYKNMKQISAIFEIYKTKNEQYLNANGRSWRHMYKDYGKRRKAEKAMKKGK